MAQLMEDHVSRNLSQLPEFGLELPEMKFSSVNVYSNVSTLFTLKRKKNKCFYNL